MTLSGLLLHNYLLSLRASLCLLSCLLLLHYHLLSLRASLCFNLFASLSLLSCLHSSPPVHLLAHRSVLLLDASLRFRLLSLLRHLRLPRGLLLGLPYLLLLKISLRRLTLLFLSLLLLCRTRGLLLAFGSPLLFHLLLLLSLLRRSRGLLLAFGSPLLFHLLLLLSLLRRRGCLLLSLDPALLLHLLPRLFLLSLLLCCGWWLLSSALLFAHKLAHFAASRLVTLLGPTCEFTHPLRLS